MLPENLTHKPDTKSNPFEENEKVAANEVSPALLLKYEIHPFTDEDTLPNFIHATGALQYFKVLREILFDWTRAKHHHRGLIDSTTTALVFGLHVENDIDT